MSQTLFLVSSALSIFQIVARKPQNQIVAISLIAGLSMGGFTMHKIIHGNELERIAIAQFASASTCVCTTVFILSVLCHERR